MMAYFDNGTYNPSFNPFDNDYIEIVSSSWDTDKNIKEGLNYNYLSEGPKL